MKDLENISWDNTTIYKSFDDPKLSEDLIYLKKEIGQLEELISIFEGAQACFEGPISKILKSALLKDLELKILTHTIAVYASCALSVDSKNEKASKLETQIQGLALKLKASTQLLDHFLIKASEKSPQEFDEFFSSPELRSFAFEVKQKSQWSAYLLSPEQEKQLIEFSRDGLHAWGKLYQELSSSIKLEYESQKMGLAQANSLLSNSDQKTRKEIYYLIKNAWQEHEVSLSYILNSLNGWRDKEQSLRSYKKPLDHLDVSCMNSRIQKKTLETLMEVTYQNRSLGHRALKGMAHEMNVSELGPWDLQAPYPNFDKNKNSTGEVFSFVEGMNIIIEAFSSQSKEMAEFAKMMFDRKWIDSTPGPNRRPGAYCTKFANDRTPRVFMTYSGSMKNIITLAHELGHAYHNWVLRECPFPESRYPMTLAETASVFAETIVKNYLLENSLDHGQKKKVLWQEATSASAFLINIPTRFEFEKRLVEKRSHSFLSPNELKALMKESWEKWYGDTLSEYDEMFWANKLHFSISSLGFYNYPYLFGYLFSLGIYGQKDQLGESFFDCYKEILKDTGKMTAEDLIQKHFNLDIREPYFWKRSLSMVEQLISDFEKMVYSKELTLE